MLATAVGQALTKHMHELLDLMFAFGLSSALHGTLVSLGKDIPALLPEIQGKLFAAMSLTGRTDFFSHQNECWILYLSS